jgi:hypothetical protein
MKSFIKATEIWEPNRERTELTLVKGLYGTLKKFEDVSQAMTFTYDEGLPGKAWAQKHPIVLTDLSEAYFKRTEIADEFGLTAAIALPIFCGEYLNAVVVFFCGDSDDHAGAIELWSSVEGRRNELGLVDGYYGTMDEFAWISKSIKIMKGQGLPGVVWNTGMPLLLDDLANSGTFMRASKALKEGITTALAMPAWIDSSDAYIMSFLSAKGTPIARKFEIWVPDHAAGVMRFEHGYSDTQEDLKARYEGVTVTKQEGTLGMVWKNGHPLLTEDTGGDDYDALLAIPLLEQGFLKAVVLFCF